MHSVCCTADIVVLIIIKLCDRWIKVVVFIMIITIIDNDKDVFTFDLYLIFLRV
jgi:hypothetical protein